jgi:hypothetical protein
MKNGVYVFGNVVGKETSPQDKDLTRVPWHSIDKTISYSELMMRELCLMAITLDRDWAFDDTSLKEQKELQLIAKGLNKYAKRLNAIYGKPNSRVTKKRGK